MSKETKEFDVVVMDCANRKVTKTRRRLPVDITKVELEELLVLEGDYDQNTCHVMFGDHIKVEAA
jgi:hypothetical protein